MNNEIFKDNSKYFRNALVRANYRDISINVYEDNSFLYKFFSNLLLKTNYVLNNEELYIDKKQKEKISIQMNPISNYKKDSLSNIVS